MLLQRSSRALSSLVSSRLSPRRTERVSLPVGLLVTCAHVCVRVLVARGGEKGGGPLCTLYLLAGPRRLDRFVARLRARLAMARVEPVIAEPGPLQAESSCVFSARSTESVWHVSGANRPSAKRALRDQPPIGIPIGIWPRASIPIPNPRIFRNRRLRRARRSPSTEHCCLASQRSSSSVTRGSRATGLRSRIGNVRDPTCSATGASCSDLPSSSPSPREGGGSSARRAARTSSG